MIIVMPAPTSRTVHGCVEPFDLRQIEIYRHMTGEQRLLLSLDMILSTWRIAADAIRNETPRISDQELRAKLQERRAWANSRPR